MQTYSLSYPVEFDHRKGISLSTSPVDAAVRALLDVAEGTRVGDPDYGTTIEELLQSTSEVDDLLPVVLSNLRGKIEKYIHGVRVLNITAKRDQRVLQVYLKLYLITEGKTTELVWERLDDLKAQV
jgi:phage baseplate assembly protein W